MYVRLLDNSGKAVVAAQQQPLSNNHKHDIHNRAPLKVQHAVHVISHTENYGVPLYFTRQYKDMCTVTASWPNVFWFSVDVLLKTLCTVCITARCSSTNDLGEDNLGPFWGITPVIVSSGWEIPQVIRTGIVPLRFKVGTFQPPAC